MKRLTAICLIIIISVVTAGCAGKPTGKKLSIVTSIFPVYDWVSNITRNTDNTELSLLLDNGVDMHSFQPSAKDIVAISDCDVFIYIGGESDAWVDDALSEKHNKNMVVINLMDELRDRIKQEELAEGMEGEADEAADEHIWLSLRNAEEACRVIADKLSKTDSSGKKTYSANAESYIKQLSSLDRQYADTVNKSKLKTLLFGDRFPFRYMVDDYGLKYYAAFSGCSAETEASFKTIAFLSKKADELGLKSVIKIENSDGRVAETIVENTKDKNQTILTLDSIQSITSDQIKSGTTYLSVMESNLSVLEKALKE